MTPRQTTPHNINLNHWNFSGSYDPADVTFLLRTIELDPTPIAEKEKWIQSGQRHYSEMISRESPPTDEYLRLFHEAFTRNLDRFALDLLRLVDIVQSQGRQRLAIVSLARAGTPIGVLINRALGAQGVECRHFSISIIRDRGIDQRALAAIRQHYTDDEILFLDGWTGKGVIAKELAREIESYNSANGSTLDSRLYVIADLCGTAGFAATNEDYLIPSSIMGGTISGLVSRSILNDDVIQHNGFHGCVELHELASNDLSRWFVDEVWKRMQSIATSTSVPDPQTYRGAAKQTPATPNNKNWNAWLRGIMKDYAITDVNYVKPGICEATRVMLRRVPDRLLLRDINDLEVAHLRLLANQKCVPITIDSGLPTRALALIKNVIQPTPTSP